MEITDKIKMIKLARTSPIDYFMKSLFLKLSKETKKSNIPLSIYFTVGDKVYFRYIPRIKTMYCDEAITEIYKKHNKGCHYDSFNHFIRYYFYEYFGYYGKEINVIHKSLATFLN